MMMMIIVFILIIVINIIIQLETKHLLLENECSSPARAARPTARALPQAHSKGLLKVTASEGFCLNAQINN